jgi:hypothetical protein
MIKSRTLAPVLAGLLLGWSGTAAAQHDEFLQFSGQHNLATSAAFPSAFGEDGQRYYINLPSFHFYGGSDFLKLNEAKEILNGGEIPASMIDGIMGRLGNRNHVFAGGQVSPLAIGYQVRKDDKELFTLSMSWTEQAAAQLVFGEYLPRVAWEGNAPFAGTRLDLGPIEGNAFLRREFAIGAAFPIWQDDKVSMRAGFRGKFFMSSAAAHVRPAQAELYTAADGSLIEYDLLVKAQLAGSTSINPLAMNGSGVGIDFGTSMRWTNGFSFDFALNDIGYMRHGSNITTRVFEGFEVEDPSAGIGEDEIGQFNDYFQTESTPGGSFRTSLGTRIQMRGGYALKAYDRSYDQHAFHLAYVQGFGDAGNSSIQPIVTAAYVYTVANILELGATVGYAHKDIDAGAFFSVRGGPFRFGLGSGDISGLVLGGNKASGDASMRMSLAF